jgi:hypothetical protein
MEDKKKFITVNDDGKIEDHYTANDTKLYEPIDGEWDQYFRIIQVSQKTISAKSKYSVGSSISLDVVPDNLNSNVLSIRQFGIFGSHKDILNCYIMLHPSKDGKTYTYVDYVREFQDIDIYHENVGQIQGHCLEITIYVPNEIWQMIYNKNMPDDEINYIKIENLISVKNGFYGWSGYDLYERVKFYYFSEVNMDKEERKIVESKLRKGDWQRNSNIEIITMENPIKEDKPRDFWSLFRK